MNSNSRISPPTSLATRIELARLAMSLRPAALGFAFAYVSLDDDLPDTVKGDLLNLLHVRIEAQPAGKVWAVPEVRGAASALYCLRGHTSPRAEEDRGICAAMVRACGAERHVRAAHDFVRDVLTLLGCAAPGGTSARTQPFP